MASKQEMEIIIHPDGTVTGDVTKGPGGKGCISMLDGVMSGLGKKVSEAKKPEFYDNQLVGRAGIKRSR